MICGLKIKNIFFILLGASIYSFGIVHFNMQNNLGEGELTGITLLLFFIWKLDPAFTNIILNIPTFFIGWKLLGTFAISVFLFVFQKYQFTIQLQDDMTLVALFAGVFIGVGLGVIFRFSGTSGGVDIIARLANKY